MGNTVPARASGEATGRRGAGTGRGRSENVVTGAAPPATPSREQGADDDDGGDVEEETAHAGRALRAGGAVGAAPAPATAGKVLTVKIVVRRKDAEALVARLEARSARERKARMAELRGELRAGSCCSGGGACRDRDARRPVLPPIQENRFERTQVV